MPSIISSICTFVLYVIGVLTLLAVVCGLICGFFVFPIICIVNEVKGYQLQPASCTIMEVLKNDRYGVFVIPNDTDSDSFQKTITAKYEGFTIFTQDQVLDCFWGSFCSSDEFLSYCSYVLQFHSIRKDIHANTIVQCSIPLVIALTILSCALHSHFSK